MEINAKFCQTRAADAEDAALEAWAARKIGEAWSGEITGRGNPMVLADADLTDMQRAVTRALTEHWRLFLFQGAIMIILGVLAVGAPMAATLFVAIYLGWLFLISGIIGLVALFSMHDTPAFVWNLITAALSVVAGVVLIWKPVEGAISLTLVLAALFIAEGVFQMGTSIAYRHVMANRWGWMLVSGIADLVLAALIIVSWPLSAAWFLGLLAGINLITSGWAIIVAALAGRNLTRTAPATVPAASH
jgi:uncharacterized membrane protein HdeD (DUF308 family)